MNEMTFRLHYESDPVARQLFQQTRKERAEIHDKMLGRYAIDAQALRAGTAGRDILTNFNIYLAVEPIR